LKLFKELQRRNVIRVAIGYIVSSWLLLQIADLVLDIIGSPGWVLRTIALLFALGFPIVVFFSWAYEVTPEGVRRESEVDRNQSITHVTGRKLDYSILVVLVISLAYFVWESRFSGRAQDAAKPQGVESVVDNGGMEPDESASKNTSTDRLSIAVLPFENRSNREEDQFFTDGIHDDLLTTIAKIGSMKVISRTSVMEYKNTTKKIPEIASELRVANILEGGIQRSGNQVRVNVQLIDASTDQHLWAEIYDRELTAENLFAIQSEISSAIADQLRATLSPDEIKRINAMPTDNLKAYNAYLRGRQLLTNRLSEELGLAVQEFKHAVELDPGFVLAWVSLAYSHELVALIRDEPLERTHAVRQAAIDRALDLDPLLGEAWTAQGSIYDEQGRSDDARRAFLKGIKLSPNYADGYFVYALTINNPLRIREKIALVERALELDPRQSHYRSILGQEYFRLGDYAQGEHQLKTVLELNPNFALSYHELGDNYLWYIGDFVKSLQAFRKAVEIDAGDFSSLYHQMQIYLELGQPETARSIRQQLATVNPTSPRLIEADVELAIAVGDSNAFREAAGKWQQQLQAVSRTNAMSELATSWLRFGEMDRARELLLLSDPGWLQPDEWEPLVHNNRGDSCIAAWILIHSGDTELGGALLDRTTRFLEEELPAVLDHADTLRPDLCHLATGDTEKALDSIETQLDHNHIHGWDFYHALPMYKVILEHPRYLNAMSERTRRLEAQRQAIDTL
jgi:TolB-like protein/cytochrome c-type biogenesis protein CcmH/NrfG